MGRPRRHVGPFDPDKTLSVWIKLNPKQIAIVNRLYEGGLHGNTGAAVVERIFCEGCALHAQPIKPEPTPCPSKPPTPQ